MGPDLQSFTKDQLVEIVANLRRDNEELRYTIGELTSDPEFTEGLTHSQSRIVGFLRRCAGRVCTKQQIMDAMFYDRAIDETPGIKIVDVQVCKIRARRPDIIIETVWGHGYRFIKENAE